jgi:hypothetical protein
MQAELVLVAPEPTTAGTTVSAVNPNIVGADCTARTIACRSTPMN